MTNIFYIIDKRFDLDMKEIEGIDKIIKIAFGLPIFKEEVYRYTYYYRTINSDSVPFLIHDVVDNIFLFEGKNYSESEFIRVLNLLIFV